MGFLSGNNVQRVDLGNGYWADLREITADEYTDVEKHLSRTVVMGDKVEIRPDLTGFRKAMVLASIHDWNLTDENDKPLPLRPHSERVQSIGRLPVWAFERIREVADGMNGKRKGKDEAQFRDAGAGGAEVGESGSGVVPELPDGVGVLEAAGAAG